MRIVVVSATVPFPPIGGGRMRTYQLIRALADSCDVRVAGFTFEGETYDEPDIDVDVIGVPWQPPHYYDQLVGRDGPAAHQAYDRLQFELAEPWFVSYYESAAMAGVLAEMADYDLVLFEGTDMAQFIHAVAPDALKVLDLMDVHSLMALRAAESAHADAKRVAGLEAEKTLRFEREAASLCDLCLTVSSTEAQAARNLLEIERVEVVPNGVDTSFFAPGSEDSIEPGNILFTGTMTYGPNVQAAVYFAREVLPLIEAERPGVIFHVVGVSPPEEILELASLGVKVHGSVPDIRPFLHRSEVVVVPLLEGGGTRLKLLEAAAAGCAMVSTSLGAEGLDLVAGQDLLVADGPKEFATAVLQLMSDVELARDLRSAARARSLGCDWSIATAHLMDLLGVYG